MTVTSSHVRIGEEISSQPLLSSLAYLCEITLPHSTESSDHKFEKTKSQTEEHQNTKRQRTYKSKLLSTMMLRSPLSLFLLLGTSISTSHAATIRGAARNEVCNMLSLFLSSSSTRLMNSFSYVPVFFISS